MHDDLLDFAEDDDGTWILEDETERDLKEAGILPPGYCIEYADQAYKLCLLGATDEELADFFNVDEEEYQDWRIEVPAFAKAVIEGKDIADAEIAHSFYQRAKGYKCKEDKVVSYLGDATVVRINKQYPPDTQAGMFWLTTRQRDKWGKDAYGVGKAPGYIKVLYPDDWDSEDLEDLEEQ